MPKVVAIVQARMTSTRLPGKVLADISGRPALDLLVRRLMRATRPHEVVVATSTDASDDPVAAWSEQNDVICIRGPLQDVLERFRIAAESRSADAIVRITADCPLVDPLVVDDLVEIFLTRALAYCSLGGEFPHGIDCEIFSREALEAAASEATLLQDREHVTPFMRRSPVRFPTARFAPFVGHHGERWTIDHPEDLALVRALTAISADPVGASVWDFLALMDDNPELRQINRGRVVAR